MHPSSASPAAASGGQAIPRPGPGFPGPSAEASHGAWPGGRQPERWDYWPQRADGSPERCWKTSVLQDMHLGWPGKCRDLMRTAAQNALECHQSCTEDPLCAVWSFNYMTQCWQGVGRGCGEASLEGSDLLATGAQRLQHGDAVVLKDFAGWHIFGLHDIGDTSWGTSNHTLGAQNCRAWCYSNLLCQYWQYAPGQCFVEDPGATGKVHYPLILSKGATQESAMARKIIAGEYIAHTCPAAPSLPPSLGLSMESSKGSAVVGFLFDICVAVLLVFAISRVWLRMRGFRLGQPKLGGAVRPTASGELGGCFWNLDQVVPVPVLTILLPTNLDPLLHGTFATSAEKAAVQKALPGAPLPYANLLALRRSCTAALLVLGIVSYVVQCRVLFSTWQRHEYFKDLGRSPGMESYETWVAGNPLNPSFVEYSKDKGLALLAGIVGEVLRGAFLVDFLVSVMELGLIVLLSLAVWNWTSFTTSRRLILRACFIAFVAGFGVSVLPVRLLLSFEESERRADLYVRELAVALNLDKAQDFLLGSCARIQADDQLSDEMHFMGSALKKTCSRLGFLPISLAVPCIGSLDICHVNLRQALSGCREAVQQFEIGHAQKAIAILKGECQRLQDAFVASTDVKQSRQDRSHAFEALVDMLRMPFHAIVPSVELVSMTISSIHSMFMVLPPVLGMAPGFMAAGFATKVLAPHSYLAGAIIMIVPIVLISVGWLLQTMVFQWISNLWLLLLLTCLVLYPLVFIWIAQRYRLTMPVDLLTLQRAARAAVLATVFVGLAAVALLPLILRDVGANFGQMQNFATLLEWFHVSWLSLGLSCFARTVYSFALTFYGAADWMMGGIALQQRYWHFWSKLGALGGSPYRRPEETEEQETFYRPPMEEEAALRQQPQQAGRRSMKVAATASRRRRKTMADLVSGNAEAEEIEESNDKDVADFLWHRLACREAAEASQKIFAKAGEDDFAWWSGAGTRFPWMGMEAMALNEGAYESEEATQDSGSESSSA